MLKIDCQSENYPYIPQSPLYSTYTPYSWTVGSWYKFCSFNSLDLNETIIVRLKCSVPFNFRVFTSISGGACRNPPPPYFRAPKVIGQLASQLLLNSQVYSIASSTGIGKLSVSILDSRLLIAFGVCSWHLSTWGSELCQCQSRNNYKAEKKTQKLSNTCTKESIEYTWLFRSSWETNCYLLSPKMKGLCIQKDVIPIDVNTLKLKGTVCAWTSHPLLRFKSNMLDYRAKMSGTGTENQAQTQGRSKIYL